MDWIEVKCARVRNGLRCEWVRGRRQREAEAAVEKSRAEEQSKGNGRAISAFSMRIPAVMSLALYY